LNLSNSYIDGKTCELLSVAIGENPVGKCSKLKILNLSKNQIGIEGAKFLS